jgi:thiamine-phosphate pyrophosphorylase
VRLTREHVSRIYALTSDADRIALPEQVQRLDAAGIRWIQVRDKRGDDLHLWNDLQKIRALQPAAKIFVNDRVDLAFTTAAHGVHLGDHDLPAAAARLIAPDLLIGVSTHDVEQAVAAAADPAVDYVAIGPIFASPTKNVRAPLGLSVITELRRLVDKPIVAIGGITVDNVADLFAAGADSAAVISALFEEGAIERNAARLLEVAERSA